MCASLLASAFTVNADVSTDYGKNIDLAAGVTTLQGANATAQPGFSVTNPVGVYQLRDQSNKVLAWRIAGERMFTRWLIPRIYQKVLN